MGIKDLARASLYSLKAEVPEMMVGGAIVLFAVSIIKTARDTPRYLQERDRAIVQKGEPLDAKEEVVMVVRVYRVPIALYFLGTVNVIGAFRIKNKTIATLTAGINALSLAYNKNLAEIENYKNSVKDILGETKETRLESALDQEDVDRTSFGMIYDTGEGDVIFKDKWTGLVFKSCQNAVDRAFIVLEQDLQADDWVGVDRLYEILFEKNRIGMPKEIDSFEYIGWDLQDCVNTRRYGNVLIDHSVGSTYSHNLQQAVTVLKYLPRSTKDWRGYY